MAVLKFDEDGDRRYELGISKVVLFVSDPTAANGYANGVPWNGVTKISESPSGAEANDIYADDIKYGSIRATEKYGGTIEALQSPEEFDVCDGSVQIAPGIHFGQQTRKRFAIAYISKIGNDTDGITHGQKLHLVYSATASPSSKDRETINESPNPASASWEFDTTPVTVDGYLPVSHIEIDSTRCSSDAWTALMNEVYGTQSTSSTLPLPSEILSDYATTYTYTALTTEPDDWETNYYTKYYTKYGTTYSLIPRQDSAPTFVANQYYKRDAAT